MTDKFPKDMESSTEEAMKIVPRAEFRVFERGVIDIVKPRIWEVHAVLQGVRAMPPETYILSPLNNVANVKLRKGMLDIKVRTGETPEGYEIFQPRGKFSFPISRESLAMVLSELGVHIELTEESYSLKEFIETVRRHPQLVPVNVEKTRYGFTVGNVICEYAEVWFNGALVESACCESEHYDAMAKVVEALGLGDFKNVNYLKAAKRTVGMD